MKAQRYLGVAALLAAAVVPVLDGPAPAEAQERGCEQDPQGSECGVRAPVTIPADPREPSPRPGGQAEGPGGGGGGSSSPPACRWVTWGHATVEDFPEAFGFSDAPPGALVQSYVCPDDRLPFFGRNLRWVLPDDAPPPGAAPAPSPEEVAAIVFAEVLARMERPAVAADPPIDIASIVNLPVFVQVTNWQDEVSESDCLLGVCVSVTATPQLLTFDPGEPGSVPKVCTPPGSRFDPAAGDPAEQAAAPGACAHVYTMRTGAAGRPEAWPAQVTVTWSVTWIADGAEGTFPDQVLSTSLPREVDEVQTVVVDGSSG